MLIFPLTITYEALAELAVMQEPNFADLNLPSDPDPDEDCTIAGFLRDMMDHFIDDPDSDPVAVAEYKASKYYCSFPDYIRSIGFCVYADRIEISHEYTLRTASALIQQVFNELDDTTDVPTRRLFNLGGDDDVDYFGSHPSYITDILIKACEK